MNNSPEAFLLLSHLKIQNANTISSPITWGFPALTSVLGFAHALQRKLNDAGHALKFQGVGVVCHHFEPQVYDIGYGKKRFTLTRNPLEKDNSNPATIEEGRAHMTISLVIEVTNLPKGIDLTPIILRTIQTLRFAGGSIFFSRHTEKKSKLIDWPSLYSEQEAKTKEMMRMLLPGFALISASGLLSQHTEKLQEKNPAANALDTLLAFSSIRYMPGTTDTAIQHAAWSIEPKPGWIVPIPIGFQGISELYDPGTVLNARDKTRPFQFVESVYSLGEWKSPHRILDMNQFLWHYVFDPDNETYLCKQNCLRLQTHLSHLNLNQYKEI